MRAQNYNTPITLLKKYIHITAEDPYRPISIELAQKSVCICKREKNYKNERGRKRRA